MALRFLRALPLGLGALAWAVGAGLLLLNLLLPALGRGTMKLAPALIGVTNPEKPRASWATVLDGDYQASYARLLGTRMPLYPTAVRLRNQLQYSLFGVTTIQLLMVGRGPSLFETPYSEEYCTRSIAGWHATAEAWAAQIREMQDIEERRGKVFLYVLTPSKVAQYPQIMPAGYTCPATEADRAGFTPAWVQTLRSAGVHVVDTTAVMFAAHGAYPFQMYPASGAHWNAVGAALSEQAVMAELNRLDPKGGFAPFTFTWHMIRHATGVDNDLANLLNLIRPFPAAPAPAVEVQPAPAPTPCPDTHVVIVGGSFSHAMLEYLARATCNPPATEYEYWRAYTLSWGPYGMDLRPGVNEAARDAAILAADVLVYEENEQVLPNPMHGHALWEFLHNHRDAAGR